MSVSNLTLAADIATRRRIGATLALVALVVLLMLMSASARCGCRR